MISELKFKICVFSCAFVTSAVILASFTAPALGIEGNIRDIDLRTQQGVVTDKYPPFSAEQFWNMLFQQIDRHDGYIAERDLRNILRVSSPLVHKRGTDGEYSIISPNDWNFDVYASDLGIHNDFSLNIAWNELTFVDAKELQCLRIDRAESDLTSAGWRLRYLTHQEAMFHEYEKNGNWLVLYYTQKQCVVALKSHGRRS